MWINGHTFKEMKRKNAKKNDNQKHEREGITEENKEEESGITTRVKKKFGQGTKSGIRIKKQE